MNMKKQNYICQTDINSLSNNNDGFNSKSFFKFLNINNTNLVSPNHKNYKNIHFQGNNKINNKRIINSLCQNKSLPNYSLENNLKNHHRVFLSNKNSFSKDKACEIDNNNIINKSPKNKYIFNKIEREIKMIKIQLANDILKNKIQLLNNLGNNNINKNNCHNSKNIKIRKNNTIAHKRNLILNNINNNIKNNNYNSENINRNNNNNIPNNNSLKNIYYINNNFRINSIQNNENRNIKIPKSAFVNNSPINYIQRQKKYNNKNNIINLSNINKNNISYSPNYFIPKSAFNENNNIYRYNNYNSPKSHINILVNKSRVKNNNILPQGFFDDYLLSENSIRKKNNIIIKRNKNDKNNINNTYKNETQLKNELKIEKYNNFFIGHSKEQKKPEYQTENKIIDFSYISTSKSKNLIKNNKVINTINFSFNPIKINFQNNNIKNEEKGKASKKENENKTLTEIINPCELEEKSVILDNNSIEEEKPKKKLNFDEIKIVIKYNQNDYLRNYNSLYKINMNEKEKDNDENKYDKIFHKFISTTKLCNLLKKKNKNIKSNLINNDIKYNPNLALMKLNELIDDEPKKSINKENNKPKYIQKNINFIKKLEECNKKGINCRSLTLSKNEIKLLNKNKKNLKNNTQQNLTKEKININDDNKLEKIDENDKNNLNNSFS